MLISMIFEKKMTDTLLSIKDKMIEKKMVLLSWGQIYEFASAR